MPHDDVQITILKKMLLKFMECLTCLGLTALSVLLCLTHFSNLWDPSPRPRTLNSAGVLSSWPRCQITLRLDRMGQEEEFGNYVFFGLKEPEWDTELTLW